MTEIERFLIFAIVGASGVVIDLSVFWALLKTVKEIKVLKKSKIKSITVFHGISFIISNANNYIWNSTFTFSDTNKENPSWITYFAVSIIALTVSSIFLQYFANPKFYKLFRNNIYEPVIKKLPLLGKIKLTKNLWLLGIKAAAIIVSMFFNYFGYKYLVF